MVLGRAREWLNKYGARPPASHELASAVENAFKQVAGKKSKLGEQDKHVVETWKEAPILQKASLSSAEKLLEAIRCRRKVNPKVQRWAKNMRRRASGYQARGTTLLPSRLQRALLASPPQGQPRKNLLKRPAAWGSDAPAINKEGAVAYKPVQTAVGVVQLTPWSVVDWVYQALVDVVSILQKCLGVNARFDARGRLEEKLAALGEVVLFWGTHLGSLRQQAMMAWDYDADLAVFLRPGVDMKEIWSLASSQLERLGYRCVQFVDSRSFQKFRVCPPDPLAWNPWKELYSEVVESKIGGGRPAVIRKTASLRRQGAVAQKPHGSNCIDVEVYWPTEGKQLMIQGSKPFPVKPADLFPTTRAIFGPLVFKMPARPEVLLREYGKDCLAVRRAKTISKKGKTTGYTDVPEDVRHSSWPKCPILRCPPSMVAD